MFEWMWNPQTTTERLASMFCMHPAYRDNATRSSRKALMIQVVLSGIITLALYRRNQALEAQLDNSIEMPKFEFPTFDFSTRN